MVPDRRVWLLYRLHTTLTQITRSTPKYWIHCIENFFRLFEQLALALKNRVCPEFTLLNILFYIQDFWATCACPEIFTVFKYFLSFRIFEQLALALKTEFALKVSTLLDILFTIQDFWATLRFGTRRAKVLNSLIMKLQHDHCSSICNAEMIITGVIETFAMCRLSTLYSAALIILSVPTDWCTRNLWILSECYLATGTPTIFWTVAFSNS